MKKVVAINRQQLMMTKMITLFELKMPAGISLIFVRGFMASISLSCHLLKAIAAVLANTIHKMTNKSFCHEKTASTWWLAKKNPTNAKGKAKIV